MPLFLFIKTRKNLSALWKNPQIERRFYYAQL
nr:MAG TPA: hypothetical protein [Caudoviricetes sp.]